ncbi:AbrB/MazE/SpoVT family DNA-binding domain-containing protein [Chloroflexota bacterium]
MPQHERGKFYGTATVSERGQIAIPAEVRRDFDINVGDKLLVIGHLSHQGIGLIKASSLKEMLSHMADMFRQITETDEADKQK